MSLPAGYVVRAYTPDDAEAVARFLNRVEQEPETADSVRERFARFPASMPSQRLIIEREGAAVAYGQSVALHEPGNGQPFVFLVRAHVDEPYEHRGLGRHLMALGEAFATDLGAAWLMSRVRDDLDRGRRFLEQLGYRQEQHLYGVTLELDGFDEPLVVPAGIKLVTWDHFTDDETHRRRAYECYIGADADTPGIELWGLTAYDDWLHTIFQSSWYRPEGFIVALDEQGNFLGLSIAGPTDAENVSTDFTGVLSQHRGRGIARALKVAGAHWAKSIGAKRIHTYNDDRNGPMRHINFDLGFKPQTGWRMMRKDP